MQSGRIVAALDVYYQEPLPADHPLTRAPNAVLTPHLGYSVVEVYGEYYEQSVENALAFLDGKPIRVCAMSVKGRSPSANCSSRIAADAKVRSAASEIGD